MEDQGERSLHPDEIHVERTGRRSALSMIGGTFIGGLVTALASGAEGQAPIELITDSDGGRCADPAGRGRGRRRRGITDSDAGTCADPANFGRRGGREGRLPTGNRRRVPRPG